jgi:hypothetical protein
MNSNLWEAPTSLYLKSGRPWGTGNQKRGNRLPTEEATARMTLIPMAYTKKKRVKMKSGTWETIVLPSGT